MPGGRFYATTFLQGVGPGPIRPSSDGFRFFESPEELTEIMVAAGFDEEKVEVRREGAKGVMQGCAVVKCVV